MSKGYVWVVDDDSSIRWVVEKTLSSADIKCETFADAESVLMALERETPDVLVSDIRMPGIDGIELLNQVQQRSPDLPVIIMTAHSDLDAAVNAYQKGAFEYLPKPFDIDETLTLVERAIAHSHEQKREQANEVVDTDAPEIIGEAPAMQEVFRAIGRLSRSSISVLINGESGTGKELVAHALHRHSPRATKPFIALNMAAIPKDLIESELFGHEKGAFTGAISARKGRFELAEGGTLFLDEIGDMPLQMQVKLLRVLQERTFERVGGNKPLQCNVRIIAATHRNLETMINEDKFREDLYYRLNVFPIDSPALRQRKDDIPLLLQELNSRIQGDGVEGVRFTEQAIASLMEHEWAGNVRELSNLVERLTILYPGQIVDIADLPEKYQYGDIQAYEPDYPEEILEREAFNALFAEAAAQEPEEDLNEQSHEGLNGMVSSSLPEEGVNLKEYLSELEVNLIRQALDNQDWVVARAADKLGMRRTTLVEKMRKYDIQRTEEA